jgi:CheY-like chemotaxis protein
MSLKKRILLADDDEGVRSSLGEVLAMEGYEVLPAADGHEALVWLQTEEPDLALLDINMPGLNGWQALDRIELRRPLLPIIVITARPNQYARALGAGVDALMEKPLDVPTLLEAIGELVGESREQRINRLTQLNFATRLLNQPDAVVSS